MIFHTFIIYKVNLNLSERTLCAVLEAILLFTRIQLTLSSPYLNLLSLFVKSFI